MQDGYAGWLCRMATQDGYAGWLRRMAMQDGYAGWLRRMAMQPEDSYRLVVWRSTKEEVTQI